MKPKLLVLTTTFPRWKDDQTPPFVYELASRLTASFEVTVHTPHYRGAKTKEYCDDIRVVRFRYFWEPLEILAGNTGILPTIKKNRLYLLLVPFLLVAQLSSLFYLLFRNRPDVIHAHWTIPQGVIASISSCFFKIPFIVTAHGADIYSLQGKFLNKIKAIVMKNADYVTAVSKSLAQAISSSVPMAPEKIKIIPMGVSSDIFNPAANDEKVRNHFKIKGQLLLYVGRLSEKKGVTYLIDAMPRILEKFPLATLLIVGHGELNQTLRKQVAQLGCQESIFFVGPVPNKELAAYFASADIFIGPSIQTACGDTEGFGLTFVEAAMSGCLLVGTNVGGIGDIIVNYETGLLVEEKNSNALADKVIYALQYPEKVEQLKRNGLEKCTTLYDWKVIAQKYTDLIFTVIS